MVADNSIATRTTTGIRADGSGASVRVSGNAFTSNGGTQLVQMNCGGMLTYGDNVGYMTTPGLITKVTGQ